MKAYQDTESRPVNILQRVVGALVLIAVAVIFVPMILDFRKDYDRVITGTNIPPRPEGLRVEVLPLHPPGEAAGTVPPAPPEKESTATPEPAQPLSADSVADAPAAPGAHPDRSQAGAGGGPRDAPGVVLPEPSAWVVQVGSFNAEKNALALRDRLRRAGYAAFVDRVVVDGTEILRVSVGPEMFKERTQQLRDRLAREQNLNGIVVGYR